MTQEASTGADTRPDAGDDRPITVASVPGSHVYVRHIAHEGKPSGVRRLEDPDPQAPERSTQQQWWPPVMLDPAWLADADYDLLHVHFGFDARDPAQLDEALAPMLAARPQALVLDLAHLDYISSAGVRSILKARKALAALAPLAGRAHVFASATDVVYAGRGAVVRVGHHADALEALGSPPQIVVVSKAAIPADNPELVAARAAGIPVVTRSQVLGHLARAGRSIMVCGTHGKTSTTSMLIAGMLSAGSDPSFAVGGTVLQFGTNARGGADPVFVAEADESDPHPGRSFAWFVRGVRGVRVTLPHAHGPVNSLSGHTDVWLSCIRPRMLRPCQRCSSRWSSTASRRCRSTTNSPSS